MPKELFLDVSELEAPEPFEQISAIIQDLAANQYLKIVHRKEPFPLYDMIRELGFNYRVVKTHQPDYCILIWLASDLSTAEFCHQLDIS